jgi:hypothetical protein
VPIPRQPITDELLRRLRETLDRLTSLQRADPSDADVSELKLIIERRIEEIEHSNGHQAA